jgi:hypothetical protein
MSPHTTRIFIYNFLHIDEVALEDRIVAAIRDRPHCQGSQAAHPCFELNECNYNLFEHSFVKIERTLDQSASSPWAGESISIIAPQWE